MTTKDTKEERRLNDVKALLEVFAKRHEVNIHPHQDNRLIRLKVAETFIADFIALQRNLVASQEQPQINVFDLLSFGNNEVALSALLSWLLNERSRHYHGNLFLTTLVKLCNLPLPIESLVEYRVDTEHSEQESIIDIKVYKKGEFLLYIENKILSPEGENQTFREFRDMERVGESYGIPSQYQFAIFLTPDGRQPKDHDHWHSLSLNTLVETYLGLGDKIRSLKLRHIFEDLQVTSAKWSQS